MMRKCFTPLDITEAFFDTCEFQIQPTNAGAILKEKNVEPIGYTKEGNKLYDGPNWEATFSGLYDKALQKCLYEKGLNPPTDDKSIPDCPEYYIDEILIEKPYIDYRKDSEENLERVDIKVPYESKDIVRNLGARWDPTKKTWYFFKGDDYLKFSAWLPKEA